LKEKSMDAQLFINVSSIRDLFKYWKINKALLGQKYYLSNIILQLEIITGWQQLRKLNYFVY